MKPEPGKHPLHVLHVARRFVFDEWGGTETVVWNISRVLVASGHRSEIVATCALSNRMSEAVDGIDIRRFPYYYPAVPLSRSSRCALDKKGGNPYSPALRRHISAARGISIVHCHAMGRLGGEVRLACRALGIPYVVSFHGGKYDVPAGEVREMMKPLRGALQYGRLLDIAHGTMRFLPDAAGIITVGRNELALTRARLPGKPVVHIPNGVDAARFALDPGVSFRATHDIARDVPLVLCISRIDYQKNQLALVESAGMLAREGTGVHLALVGPVTAAQYADTIRKRVQELGLSERFTLVAGLPPDSPLLPAAYREADVFVLPSFHEPFGIVVLEAWASGLPVVAAAVGGLRDLVVDGHSGLLFDPHSPAQLASHLRTLLAGPELRRALATHGRQIVERDYSWERVTEQTVAFYRLFVPQKERS